MRCALFFNGLKTLIAGLAVVPIFVHAQSLQRSVPSERLSLSTKSSSSGNTEKLELKNNDRNADPTTGERESLRANDDSDWVRNTKTRSREQIQFLLKAPPREMEQMQLNGGGGVADGGGGNISAQTGELLDLQVFSNTKRLRTRDLQALLETKFGRRIQTLEKDLPGLSDWLMFGFRKTWYLDGKGFDLKLCRPESCQTSASVFLNQDRFQNAADSEKPDMIVQALLMAQIQRSDLDVARQASVVDLISTQIQSDVTSARTVFESLVRFHLLDSAEAAERRRADWVRIIDAQLKKADLNWRSSIQNCANGTFDISKTLAKARLEYSTLAKLCLEIIRPQVDGAACERTSIQEMMDLLNHTECSRSSIFED